MCCFEQILKVATPCKTAAVLPLTSHLTNHMKQTRHADEHCQRSKDVPISDILLWTPTYGQTSFGRPARFTQSYANTGCSLKDLQEAIDDRDGWWESVV